MKKIYILIAFLFPLINCYSQTSEYYFDKGVSLLEQKDYRGAIGYFNKAIQKNLKGANLYYAYYSRGLAKYEIRNYLEAIADYTKAILIDPKFADTYFNRAVAKYAVHDYGGAIIDCNNAIQINPTEARMYYIRGAAKYELTEHPGAIKLAELREAIKDFENAIQLNRTDEDANFKEDAYSKIGNAKNKLSDFIGAIKAFNEAIQLNPTDDEAFLNRGLAKINLGQKNGACLDFNKAKELGNEAAIVFIERHCKK